MRPPPREEGRIIIVVHVSRVSHCWASVAFFLGFPADFSRYCCLGRSLMVAAADGVIGFFFSPSQRCVLSLVLLRFRVADGVRFDCWRLAMLVRSSARPFLVFASGCRPGSRRGHTTTTSAGKQQTETGINVATTTAKTSKAMQRRRQRQLCRRPG